MLWPFVIVLLSPWQWLFPLPWPLLQTLIIVLENSCILNIVIVVVVVTTDVYDVYVHASIVVLVVGLWNIVGVVVAIL